MSSALDSVWDSHQQVMGALKIVRRTVTDVAQTPQSTSLTKGTSFDGLSVTDLGLTISSLQDHLNDQTVLSLYAAFESMIRDHLIAQSVHLKTHANKPDANYGSLLAEEYESWCADGIRMDRVAKLFMTAAGPTLVGQVGQIRGYRHWIAHGKRGAKPSQTTPAFAYKALTNFLSSI